MSETIEVADNVAAARFEVRLDGTVVGFADYVLKGGTIILSHTEVQPEFEGRGLGSRLARAALDAARDAGLKVIPRCPSIARYIDRHPEYADLVARPSPGTPPSNEDCPSGGHPGSVPGRHDAPRPRTDPTRAQGPGLG